MKKFLFLVLVSVSIDLAAQIQFIKLDDIILRQMDNSDMDFGDYDNDGDLDILLSGTSLVGVTQTTESYIYRNDGNGIFTDLFADIPSLHSGAAKWGDIDNDNDLDILLTGVVGSGGEQYTRICINKGGDNFEVKNMDLPGADYGNFCDLNSDGLDDLVFLNYDLVLMINNGDDTFTRIETDYPEFTKRQSISFGDYNNDGFDDFCVCGIEYIGLDGFTRNFVYKNNQDGTFSKISFQPIENVSSVSTVWQDMDSDGDLDLFCCGFSWDLDGALTVIYENLGNDNFEEVSHNISYFDFARFSFADYDNNGYLDFIASGYFPDHADYETRLFINQGNWNFTEDLNSSFESNNIFDVEFGDIDRDADLDLGITIDKFWDRLTYLSENQNNGNNNSEPTVPNELFAETEPDFLNLSWEVATDDETNPDALTYNLYVRKDNQIIVNANALLSSGINKLVKHGNIGFNHEVSYNIENWEEGHYFWSVQAVDQAYLTSGFYEKQEFTIYHENLPDAPTNLEPNYVHPTGVELTWNDNSNDEKNYFVQRSETVSDDFNVVKILEPDMKYYNDTSISPNKEYYYRIMMINSVNEKGYSDIKYVITSSSLVNEPTDLAINQVSPSELSLSWTDNSDNETGFVLERSIFNTNNFQAVDTLPADQTNYTDAGLNSGTLYFYRVKAINLLGESDYSNIGNATTQTIQFSVKSVLDGDLSHALGMSWGDFDNDGFEDLFISSDKRTLYKNNGDGTFTEVTNSGIDLETDSWYIYAVWGDYDNDGHLDLFMVDEDYPNVLFRNKGDGTFEKVSAGNLVNEKGESKTASWNDFDNDGDLDIFITNSGQNRLYRNDGENDFTEIILDGGNYSYGCTWGDYNNDGFQDLYVGNDKKNDFYQNNSNSKFTKITDGEIVNNPDYHTTMSVAWGDYNNDGFLDLLVKNDDSNKEWLYKNDGDGTFSKVSNVFQYDIYRDDIRTGFWTDYDNDGNLDIHLFVNKSQEHYHKLYTNLGNDIFTYREVDFGDDVNYYTAFGSCYDYNNDGFNDIFICRSNNQVIENKGNGNNWIKISLKGSPSNSFGIGARVKIKSNGFWQDRIVQTLSAYHAQNGNILNFGVKNAEIIDSIIVQWPMGTLQTLTDVGVNQKLIIYESDAEIKPLYKPSNLKTTCTGGKIGLKWKDNSSDEEHFIIQRSGGGDTSNFEDYATVPNNITRFTDVDVEYYTDYYYRVKAAKGNVTSGLTNQVHVFTTHFIKGNDVVLTEGDQSSRSVAWIDYDNDLNQDLYVGNWLGQDYLYRNNGDSSFTKIPDTPITGEDPMTNFGAWADYDNDGNFDLFVANGGGGSGPASSMNNNLFKNTGNGNFTKITEGELVNDDSPSWVAGWGDYDGDDYIDLFVGGEYKSFLFKNNEGSGFTMIQDQPMSDFPAKDAVWTDYDNDDDLDLITIDGNKIRVNRNIGGGDFELMHNDSLGLPWGMSCNSINVEDFNNDGLFDLFVANNGSNRLYLNNDSTFTRILNDTLVSTEGKSKTSVCGDINNDGYIDIFVSNYGTNDHLFLNNGDTTFTLVDLEPISKEKSYTLSAALGDYNNDGTLDLFLGTYQQNNNFYINQCNPNNYIIFRLSGDNNKNIIGTKIKLYTGTGIQIREVRTNSGNGSQNSFDVHFGLGQTEYIDYVEIYSPNGVSDKIYDIDVNQTYEIDSDYLWMKEQSDSRLAIYPNPAKNVLTIEIPENINAGLLKIINLSGQTVKEINNVATGKLSIPLEEIPPGSYVVYLVGREEILYEKLIVTK